MKNTLSELVDICEERLTANDEAANKGKLDNCFHWSFFMKSIYPYGIGKDEFDWWYENYLKIYGDFKEAVKNLNHDEAVNEIVEYFNSKLSENDCNDKECIWIYSILEIPDPVLVPYLTDILKLQKENVPYYSVIDVLRWIPKEVGAIAVSEFCEAISANNPYWNDDIFGAAFEALYWIGDEKGYEFIYRSCDSEVKSISKWAKYYRDNWIEDPDDD